MNISSSLDTDDVLDIWAIDCVDVNLSWVNSGRLKAVITTVVSICIDIIKF